VVALIWDQVFDLVPLVGEEDGLAKGFEGDVVTVLFAGRRVVAGMKAQ